MNVTDGPSDPVNLFLTGGATMLVVSATVLVVAVVLFPRLRPVLGLVAAVLALVGALAVSFTTQNTFFGDAVFRGSTVWWSIGLAVVASAWWWLGAQDSTRRAGRRRGRKEIRQSSVPAPTITAASNPLGDASSGMPSIEATTSADFSETRPSEARLFADRGAVALEARGPHVGVGERGSDRARRHRGRTVGDAILACFGVLTILIAVCTFLTASGLHPLGGSF